MGDDEVDDDGDGVTECDDDCDDADPDNYPGNAELCDGLDNNCDGDADDGLLGLEELCAADSCLDILTGDPAAADGIYWVLLDGIASEVECDMTEDGGGWTLIFSDDFEAGVDPGWTLQTTYLCDPWTTLLGGYGNIAGGSFYIDLLAFGIAHTETWIELEYAKLDSWDGELAYIELDGATLWSGNLWYYDGAEVCGWNRGWDGSYDQLHEISEIASHSADTLQLLAGSQLDQDAGDESFGIDDVAVWVR